MFKDSFKYYKSKNPPPNLCNVLDFNILDSSCQANKVKIGATQEYNDIPFGLTPPATWDIFEIPSHPGLIFIKNPFTSLGQRLWTVKCLKKYSKSSNKRNIDALKICENEDWWAESQTNCELLQKLRWATLGYHHNWDTKIYSEDNRGKFPKDLKYLTEYFAYVLGYRNFVAEAAIINYYHMDSTLSGHTDHSEQNLQAPLFSCSFGQTAIFLIGGKTKEEIPAAIYLRSGDVVVMSEVSRLAYHGIPKILHADSEPWNNVSFDISCSDHNIIADSSEIELCKYEDSWKPFSQYLSSSRINMNVRQVNNFCVS